jgi:hypothetical protein
MPFEASFTATLAFAKLGAKFDATSAGGVGSATVLGNNAIKRTITITTDVVLDRDQIGNIGLFLMKNLAVAGVPPRPVLSVGTAGTPGTTTRKYVVVAVFNDGSSSVSNEATIATSAAVLNGTDFDTLSWTDVGAAIYLCFRTVSPAMPSTTGQYATSGALYSFDTGGAGDGAPVPAEIVSRKPLLIGDGNVGPYEYPDMLYAGESSLRRAHPDDMPDIHVATPDNFPTELQYTLIEA